MNAASSTPAKSEPTTPAPALPRWEYALNLAICSWLLGTIVGRIIDLAHAQGTAAGYTRGTTDALNEFRAGFNALDVVAEKLADEFEADGPRAGVFCSGTHGPACRRALEWIDVGGNYRDECGAGCVLADSAERPETD